MSALLILSWVAGVAFLVGIVVRSAAPRPPRTFANVPAQPPTANRDSNIVPIQVVFVSVTDGHVLLDCVGGVAASPPRSDDVPRAMPFAVEANLPFTAAWAAEATESVLRRWAATGALIELAIRETKVGRSVRLSGAGTRLELAMAG